MVSRSRISIIVAMDEKRGIGKNNDLLFKILEDFKRMKELTYGHSIVMGRKTYESIGRPLPNRTNIVITRDEDYTANGCIVVHSLDEALKEARITEEHPLLRQGSGGRGEIFIFGGGQIFKEALDQKLVDRLYLTVVKGDFGADTFFPDYSEFKNVIAREERTFDKFRYYFITLERV